MRQNQCNSLPEQYRHGYTEEDFARDLRKAYEYIEVRIWQTLDYAKMCKLGGKVIAAVDYLILDNAHEGIVFSNAIDAAKKYSDFSAEI